MGAVKTHTYYLAKQRRIIGPEASNPMIVVRLVGAYMRELGIDGKVGRYDGASMYGAAIRLVVGCDGKGTGRVLDVQHEVP